MQWNDYPGGGHSIYTRRQKEKVIDYMKLSNPATLGQDSILEAEMKRNISYFSASIVIQLNWGRI